MTEQKCEKIQELEIAVARLEERLSASDKALDISQALLKEWKASSNEWRQENIDQRALYIQTKTVEEMMRSEISLRAELEKRVTVTEQFQKGRMGGQDALNAMFLKIIAVLGILATVLTMFFKYGK